MVALQKKNCTHFKKVLFVPRKRLGGLQCHVEMG